MATPSFQSTSLYVGDLIPEVTEAHLFDLFREIGPVNSIRVCRDAVTRRSLGYAYVNFQNGPDAERALDALNFRELKGRPIRIMWSQRDPSIRQSGIGNIFIKNLDKEIDTKSLHDTFSAFGNILSCKVACDENGESKGYGFVHFETQEAAQRAIEKLNGMLVSGKKVFVGPFIPRRTRVDAVTGAIEYTNVYVKNLPLSYSDEQLLAMFEEFGKVTSYLIARDAEGVSRGFGFANFDDPKSAMAAVEQLHGKEIEGKVIYAARAQKKKERAARLQKIHHDRRMEQASKYQGLNVYIKNLDETIDDERLREMFSEFGTVTSAKVMLNEAGVSRQFGFVCFSAREEAARAITTMNGRLFGTKPLYVALAQRKEERAAQLEQHRQAFRQTGAPMAPGMAPGPAPMMPMFYGQMQGAQNFVYPGMMPPGPRRWAGPQSGQQGYPQMPYGQMSQRRPGRRGGPIKEGRYMGGAPRGGARGQGFRGMPPAGMPGPQRAMPREGMMVPGGQPDMQGNLAALAADAPEIQKRRLGDALYPRVAQMRPQDAPKITGMLLEMEPAEIILLLENDERLVDVVNEAARLLEDHAAAMRRQEGAPPAEELAPEGAAPESEPAPELAKEEVPSGEVSAPTED